VGSDRVDDLETGDTAIFHSSGKTPRLINILNSFVTAEVIVRAVSSFWLKFHHGHWIWLYQGLPESISNTSSSVATHQWLWKPFGSVDGKSVDSNTGVEWLNELTKTLFSRLAFSRSGVATVFPCSRAGSVHVLLLDFTDFD